MPHTDIKRLHYINQQWKYCIVCRIKKVEYGIAAPKITKGLANGRLLIIDLVQDTPKYPSTLIFLQLFYHLFTVTQTIMRVIPCIKYYWIRLIVGQAGQPAVCRHPFKTFNRSVKLIIYLPCLVIVCFGNVRAFFSGIENNTDFLKARFRFLLVRLMSLISTDFLKSNLTKFAVIWVRRHQNAGFLSPIS